MTKNPTAAQKKKLRSRQWFDNPDNPDMTALYLERYMNYGLTREELSSGKPIIGIAQSGSDLSPCNRHHLVLAHRVREGIREAGGVAFEFPVHPIQETGKRPTAALDRNLAYLGPRRNPVRLSDRRRGADHRLRQDHALAAHGRRHRRHSGHRAVRRTRCSTAGSAASGPVRAPSSGRRGRCYATGEISYEEFVELVASSAPSPGHCNTMGTASTMNSLAEALGMSLPGCAAPPAPHKERAQQAYETRQAHRRHGVGGPAALQDHDARSVRERYRRQLGDRRVDQCAHPLQRHRPACRRRARQRRLGEGWAMRCRCWSICSRPAAISARNTIAPAAFPRSSMS